MAEVSDWYMEFVAGVVARLPRDIDEATAMGWVRSPDALEDALRDEGRAVESLGLIDAAELEAVRAQRIQRFMLTCWRGAAPKRLSSNRSMRALKLVTFFEKPKTCRTALTSPSTTRKTGAPVCGRITGRSAST
jgi:hypothetical protein